VIEEADAKFFPSMITLVIPKDVRLAFGPLEPTLWSLGIQCGSQFLSRRRHSDIPG
jgi:hypothetical protein